MIQHSYCDCCGGTDIELDSTSVKLNLDKISSCDKCYHTHVENTSYFFCSLSCFLDYMKDVSAGSKKIEFDRYKNSVIKIHNL